MITEEEWLVSLHQARAIPIVRTSHTEDAVNQVKSLSAQGWPLVEVAWTTPRADLVLTSGNTRATVLGAGTVISEAMAKQALQAGAQFLVSPFFVKEVWHVAREAQVVYVPGAFTPTEVGALSAVGFRLIKLFPAVTAGLAHLRGLQDIFPSVHFMPTGGIGLAEVPMWLRAGAEAVGLGHAIAGLPLDEAKKFRSQLAQALR